MTREEFIEHYIVHFMATFDANHVLCIGHSDRLAYECSYEHALIHAEKAYQRKREWEREQ